MSVCLPTLYSVNTPRLPAGCLLPGQSVEQGHRCPCPVQLPSSCPSSRPWGLPYLPASPGPLTLPLATSPLPGVPVSDRLSCPALSDSY